MRAINLHYEGTCVFLQKALESVDLSHNGRVKYDDLYVIDLAYYKCLSALIVLLNRLHLTNGNVRVLLVSSKSSNLPKMPEFSIDRESTLSEWRASLKYRGKMLTEIVRECYHISRLEKLTIKSRLILRQLAEGCSIDALADLMEINAKSIRAITWRCSSHYGFNSSDKLISYLMNEYDYISHGRNYDSPLIVAENYFSLIQRNGNKRRNLLSGMFFM